MHLTFVRHMELSQARRMTWAASRRGFRLVWALAVAFAIIGLLMAIAGARTIALVALLMAAMYATLPWWLVAKQIRRAGPLLTEPATFTITETEVTVQTSTVAQTFLWSGFASIRESDGFWLCVNQINRPVLIIPEDCMRPEDQMELRQFLAGRGIVPPRYRVS